MKIPAPGRNTRAIVPVFRARLPPAAAILPYLEQLDASRHYTNRGALVASLETRLRETLNLGDSYLVTAASGTAALTAAIIATAGRATAGKPVAIVPGYTFVATALAAEACGYKIVFADVSPADWMLDPETLRQHPALAAAGIVLPVAPYGVPHAQHVWAAFVDATGIPAVIDAAASFETIRRDAANLTGRIPVALSFQATKSFSTGEGGAVIWSDIGGLARVAQALNFGFLGTRECRGAGFNGKMSEYHAAVGLAALDMLDATSAARLAVAATYRAHAAAAGLADQLIAAPFVASNYALFAAATPSRAKRLRIALHEAGIDLRLWYGTGTHREPHFRGGPALPHTEDIAARLIGLPMFEELTEPDIARVIAALSHGIF
jgi:dTDP-4-amino-4,6-dideoxygalactose transaminase